MQFLLNIVSEIQHTVRVEEKCTNRICRYRRTLSYGTGSYSTINSLNTESRIRHVTRLQSAAATFHCINSIEKKKRCHVKL